MLYLLALVIVALLSLYIGHIACAKSAVWPMLDDIAKDLDNEVSLKVAEVGIKYGYTVRVEGYKSTKVKPECIDFVTDIRELYYRIDSNIDSGLITKLRLCKK